MKNPQILLTNDDGIQSPGLWTAASALSELGFVNVVAPRDQFSGAGRSLPIYSDGLIDQQKMEINGMDWNVYAVGGTPAQAVLHAVFEILPEKPILQGVAQDIEQIFYNNNFSELYLSDQKSDTTVVIYNKSEKLI